MVRYQSVVTINIAVFLLMLGIGMIVALLPQRIMNLSGSVSSVGYLASAFALTYVLFQIPIGNLSDRFGFKPFLVGGYFLCSLTGLLYYCSKTSGLILWGRMLQGIGEIPVWALAPALLSIQFPDHKGRVMGLYNASLHCGLTSGSLLGVLVSRTWQGNEPFLFFAGVSFLGGMLIALFVENPNQEGIAQTARLNTAFVRSLSSNHSVLAVLAGIALYGAGYGIFITLIPAFLISAKSFNQTTVGVFFTLFYISISLSHLIAGPLSDRKGRKPTMVFGLIMATFGIAMFSGFKQPWLIVFLTLASFGLGVFSIAAITFLNECVPKPLKGTISGAFYFFWGAGFFFGPLLLGKMGQSGYWQMGFMSLAGLFMIELITCFMVVKSLSKAVSINCSH